MLFLNILMWIATHIIAPIGILMFVTWAYAMYKIRKEPTNGKFKIDEGSFTYWVTRIALLPWELFAKVFESGLHASPRGAWEETHDSFVKYECKSLCGLFWRTLFLLFAFVPGILFMLIVLPLTPVVIGIKFLAVVIGSCIIALVDLVMDKVKGNEGKAEELPEITFEIDEQALVKHAYRYYLYCKRDKKFARSQEIFERDLEFLNQAPAQRAANHLIFDALWNYSYSFVMRAVFGRIGIGNTYDIAKWFKENTNEEFVQKVKRAAIAGNAMLCNQYPIRSLVYSLKKVACPMVEFVPASKPA